MRQMVYERREGGVPCCRNQPHRTLFLIGTIGFSVIFLGLTVDTIWRVPDQTKQQNLIPDETGQDLFSPALAKLQLVTLVMVGVAAIIGFHVNWWEGRKFLEIPRPLDYLVVVDVLLFIFNIGMTLLGVRGAQPPA